MVMRIPIVRVPIKLRKPIHKSFCKCWGIQVFSIEGVPQFINGDRFTSVVHLMDFLEQSPVCLPIHFQYHESLDSLIGLAIASGVPVVLKTNRVLPTYILEELRKVPHSGIQVSINFLDGLLRKRLETGASDTFELRQMISLAKSWKIFTSLTIDYMPHLVSKLDLFEIIESVKNYVSHMFISFPTVSDDLFHDAKTRWESLKQSSSEKFKQYYMPEVPSRTWVVRPRHKEDIINSLTEFLKGKRIGLEIVDHHKHNNGLDRIRHISSGLADLPLGIRPFFYGKEEGVFRKTDSVEGFVCEKCEKTIFA